MNLGKISFLKRMYLAITDFRMYPYTQKEKMSRAVAYFFKLVIFTSIILGAFVTSNLFKELPTILNMYETNMPEFSIVNGELQTVEKVNKELNDDTYLIVNPDYTYNEINTMTIEENEEHLYYVLVLADTTVLGARIENSIQELARIQYEPGMTFTKEQLTTDWKMLNESLMFKLLVWLTTSIAVFIVLAIARVWTLIMYIISAYIINFMFGLKLKVTEYLKVAIYVSTMPIILEAIALLMVGTISETVNFISMLISCVYIFYALRAIKLDSLILGGSGKNAEEKIKNALAHAQEELEKQLEELEKKENDEQSKQNEKKEIENLNNELKEKEENLIKAQKEYEEVIKKAMSLNEERTIKEPDVNEKKEDKRNDNDQEDKKD